MLFLFFKRKLTYFYLGVPLVYESFDWQHGVFLGASMRSEATAAAEHKGKNLFWYVLKSNLYHTRGITPKRATSGGAHLRDVALGNQLRRNIAAVASGPGIEPQTSRTVGEVCSHYANWPMRDTCCLPQLILVTGRYAYVNAR